MVAAIFSVLAVVVLVIVAAQVIGDLIIATPFPADAPTPDADSGARSGRATSALLIAVGSILLLAAAALAALDVRGRQRHLADTPTALRGTQATLDKAPGILENPGKFRSTLALLVTGVLVVLIGFIGQLFLDVGPPPDSATPSSGGAGTLAVRGAPRRAAPHPRAGAARGSTTTAPQPDAATSRSSRTSESVESRICS